MVKIKIFSKPKLKNPILIEGLPGVGNIGRVAVGYMIEELKAKKFAELYSKHFFPFVMLHDEYKVHLLKNEFYYIKAKKANQRDVIFMVGDCQSLSPHGHYEIMEAVLDFAEKFNVKDVITIGGLATGELEKDPEVIGAVTDEKLIKKYKGLGIKFDAGERVGYIVGAAGLLVGLCNERGMNGLCLLGETSGFPIVTDPKSGEMVLNVLTKILKVKINTDKLEDRVKEMEKFIKKVETLQRKALSEINKSEKAPVNEKEQLRYIG
ncbi:MAG: proteasome assembly chaperone family protein [Nanoarchaeota archaeon]|nr:proteasome assembly chaperone family protein [Nanoarchaeota archaeon]MBU1135630.1 proteasome assembly chaperone family protein [Nanoarchaeota archaeon]MBU2519995.1 proteasome assembly chaperone family protein [Nanoarchaeota archaeon]